MTLINMLYPWMPKHYVVVLLQSVENTRQNLTHYRKTQVK